MIGHLGITDSALERFCLGNASRRENRRIVRHLVAGCARCLERTRRLWPPASRESAESGDLPDANPYNYDEVFGRLEGVLQNQEIALADESAAVPALMAELRRHPPDRQMILIQNSRQFRLWGLAQALLADCVPAAHQDPADGVALAQLAIWVSDALDPSRYGRRRVNDLRARARAELGEALRSNNQYRSAAIAFRESQEIFAHGTGDAAEKAHILYLEAALWIDCHRFDEASRLLGRVISLARRIGEKRLLCQALLNQVRCEIERGSSDRLLPLSLEAQRLLDTSSDPRLALVLQHNVLLGLAREGRFEEAAAGLEDTRTLHQELNYPIDRLRFDWLEGEVLFGLGRVDEAEAIFRATLDSFMAREMFCDAALVALELALVLERQNRFSELRELSTALVPLFQSELVARDVIAALLIFREAVERERLSRELIDELKHSIRQGSRLQGQSSSPRRMPAPGRPS